MKLLDFVALYGLVLIPMGAVITADYYFIPKLGLQSFYAEKRKIEFNLAAAGTWFLMLALALFMKFYFKVELYFLPAPVWIISLGVYLLFSKLYQQSGEQGRNANKNLNPEQA
jgi:purine-cytosine permease-like protein